MIRSIATDVLRENPPQVEGDGQQHLRRAARDASLTAGTPGYALLFEYLADADLFDGGLSLSAAYLDAALGVAKTVPLPLPLYSGVAGIGWVLARSRADRRWKDDRGLGPVVDGLASAVRSNAEPTAEFDLVSGVTGYGVLGLEAMRSGEGASLVSAVSDWLTSRMDNQTPGTWLSRTDLLAGTRLRSSHRATRPDAAPYVNLGVAHGIPGTLALLDDVRTTAASSTTLVRIVDAGIRWLFSQVLPTHEKSTFPWGIGRDVPVSASRAAWCYGDPGIAAVLHRVCGRSDYHRTKCRTLLDIAARALGRDPADAEVRDPGLCHGAAGLAHIANRLFWTTGDERFLHLARRWFSWVLRLHNGQRRYGGVERWQRGRYYADPGFLTGAAGVALALAAAVTTAPPTWDRCLLLSTAEPSRPKLRSGG